MYIILFNAHTSTEIFLYFCPSNGSIKNIDICLWIKKNNNQTVDIPQRPFSFDFLCPTVQQENEIKLRHKERKFNFL